METAGIPPTPPASPAGPVRPVGRRIRRPRQRQGEGRGDGDGRPDDGDPGGDRARPGRGTPAREPADPIGEVGTRIDVTA